MTLTLWIVSLVIAALAIADQARRSPSQWTAADRDRGSWMTWTVLVSLVFLGPIAALAYAIGVVPRFGQAGASPAAAGRTPSAAPAAHSPPARPYVPPQRLWSGIAPDSARFSASAHEPLPDTPPRRKLVIEIDDV
jgi:hypothetical protein